MPPPVRPTLFSVCDLYPFISRKKIDSSVSQDSVIKIKVNHFIIRFELVIKSAIFPVGAMCIHSENGQIIIFKIFISLRP